MGYIPPISPHFFVIITQEIGEKEGENNKKSKPKGFAFYSSSRDEKVAGPI